MNANRPENQHAAELKGRPLLDRCVWILIVLALTGFAIFAAKNKEAFPEASIDLRLSKEQIKERALDCARRFGYRKDKLICSTTFGFDDSAKTYLEMELGGARANALMKNVVPVWYWRTSLCREFDQERFVVYISPVGKLISFQTALQNDKALPSVGREQARELAQEFIAKQAGIALSDYTLIESSSSQLAKRTDHAFTFEDRKHPLKDAHMRIAATVSGNAVSMYYQYLYVPEQWQRKFQTIRSYNNILGRIAFFFNSFLYLAALFIVIRAITSANARWCFAAVAGVLCALGCALLFLNLSPSVIDAYSPRTAYKAYLVGCALNGLCGSFGVGLFAALLIMAGEYVYRSGYPGAVAMENLARLATLKLAQTAQGLIVGLAVFGIALGWVVVYYLLGSHFGFWCPLDISSYQTLGSLSPAYGAMCLGVEAAFNEEILYRVIGLGLAKRIVHRFWLANLLQAAAWGFAHSTYPQQPAYARGIELTLSGLLFGWVMNRFGLLPCLVAHYMLDAFLTAQPLFASQQPWLMASAALPLLPVPLLAVLSLARARRDPDLEQRWLNAAVVAPPPAVEQAPPHQPLNYQALSAKTRAAAIVVFVVCLGVAAVVGPAKRIASDSQVSLDRNHAVQKAWQVLSEHNVAATIPGHALPAWHVAAWLNSSVSSEEMQYLYEHLGLKKTIELARATQPQYFWQVRFFKPMQAQEFEVDLDGRANEIDFDSNLPEDAPGASLTEEQARAIAQDYLNKHHSAYCPFTYESAARTERKNRLDYNFTFKVPDQKVAEADSKLYISVIGDRVSQFSQAWSLPDQWKWARDKKTWRDELFANVRIGFYVVLFLLVLWWMIGLLRVGYFPFRAALIFGAAMAIVFIPGDINNLAALFRSSSYKTTMEFGTFYINQTVRIFESLLSHFGQYGLTLLIALPCARLLAPHLNPLTLVRATFAPSGDDERRAHRNIWIDAVLISYGALALLGLTYCLFSQLKVMVSPAEQEAGLDGICALLNTFLPGLALLIEALSSGVRILTFVPIVAGFYAKYLRSFWRSLLFALIVVLINCSTDRYWQDYVLDCAWSLIIYLLGWFFVVRLARFNLLTYLLFGSALSLASTLPLIIQHAPRLLFAEANATLVLLVVPLIYVAYLHFSRRGNGALSESAS